jgi:hypothetical protein
LFGVADVEDLLEDWLQRTAPPHEQTTQRDRTADWLLDDASEPVIVAGQPYPMSEALSAIDPEAYRAVVAAISESRNVLRDLHDKYPNLINPEIKHVGFVHYEGVVFLKTEDSDGDVTLTDAEFIGSGDEFDRYYFSSERSPDENADLLVNDFDSYSISNCFELFTEEATKAIVHAHQASQTTAQLGLNHNSNETAP